MKNKVLAIFFATILSACSLVQHQAVEPISQINPHEGYRLKAALEGADKDNTLVIMMFSGGGTRAAALGYGVLEELNKHPIQLNKRKTTLFQAADIVYGVSGGSVLATYYALHGAETIPKFEQQFLKQKFQQQTMKATLSLANSPRLISPQFGRGDLLQEQFESVLFGNTTFGDLAKRRAGRPFAVVSATDMVSGDRLDFIQETFDVMCLNLSDMRLARAVAASSSVPFVFSPIVLNNNGGNCHYAPLTDALPRPLTEHEHIQDKEIQQRIEKYSDSKTRPYIHLLDGGLTDNLGMRGVLDLNNSPFARLIMYSKIANNQLKRIIILNVNAQNQPDSKISTGPNSPSARDVAAAIINIPIDQNSKTSLQQMNHLVAQWKAQQPNIEMNFISVNLPDLPEGELRQRVLNLPTSFYLPHEDVNALKQAATILLQQNAAFQNLLHEMQ